MTCGIYMIKNKETGQIYIGQSINIEQRWREHCSFNKNSSYIDKAIHKNGKNKFNLYIIAELPNNEEILLKHEKYWIKFYNTFKNRFHYNLTPGGDFNPMNIPEIAKKSAKKRKGKHLSAEHKKNISNSMIGKNKNKKRSSEIKEKISLTVSNNNNTSGFYRVYKRKSKDCKQGFIYCYRYYDNDGNRKAITSTNIKKLEQKVKAQNLKWLKLDK